MRIPKPKKSPAICGKRIAGFLLGNYNRNKNHYILICYIFTILLVISINSAYGLEASSSLYTAEFITFAQGGGSLTSANMDATYSILGESFSTSIELTRNEFSLLAGQLYMLTSALYRWESRLISDLRGLTEVLGSAIEEASWQRDNDPYFYWTILTEPPGNVAGFAVSLDSKPAHQINTTATYYQFPENSITSGKHTFYVLPFTSETAGDEDSLLKFDIWVDVDAPVVSHLRPAPGETISNNLIPISCNLSDADSGVDLAHASLTLNNSILYFAYDAEKQTLKFTPTSPVSEGKNTVLLKAYDMVGNYAVKGWDFIVDTQAPTGSIKLNNGEEFTHSAYVFINIEAEEAVSGIKNIYLSNDGIFDTELQHPYPYAPVIYNWLLAQPDVDGKKTVYAKFEDLAGNLSQTYRTSINLKLLTPDTRIISGPASFTEETEAHFKFEASKPNCRFSYKLDNLDWSAWSASQQADFSGLTSANHYFYVKSGFDLNGDSKITIDEEDATPAQWVWTVKAKGEVEKEKEKILFYRR